MWAWNVMRVDVIVNLRSCPDGANQMFRACSLQSPDVGMFVWVLHRLEMRNTSGRGKTCTQMYTLESKIAMVHQWLRVKVSCFWPFPELFFLICVCLLGVFFLSFVWVWVYQTVMGGGGHSVVRVEKGVEKNPLSVEQEVSVYFFISWPRR